MPKTHQVKQNESLLSIAREHGFRTEKPLVDANPDLHELVAGNVDVLPPGHKLKVPDKAARVESASTDASHTYRAQTVRKDLILTLQGPDGSVIQSGFYKVTYDGQEKESHRLPPGGGLNGLKRLPKDGRIVEKDWPPHVREAHLRLRLSYESPNVGDGVKHLLGQDGHDVEIRLHIGGKDPLVGENREKAVQKLLTNLGLYSGGIDGNLGPKSRAAVQKFQHLRDVEPNASRLVDETTVASLLTDIEATIGREEPPDDEPKKRDRPLKFADAPTSVQSIADFTGYIDPYDRKAPTTRQPFENCPPLFMQEAYVATSNSGENANPNVIRMKSRYFIFLDSGRWLSDKEPHRDFGVIWGRHVYLCEYSGGGGGVTEEQLAQDPNDEPDRLDRIFFAGMQGRVKVRQRATAYWANEKELDWKTLIVVIPDMHLLPENIAQVWTDGHFRLGAALDLLDFAQRLVGMHDPIHEVHGKIQVIQIGDSYDLWVGRAPRYFTKNDDLRLELAGAGDQKWSCRHVAYHEDWGVLSTCPGNHPHASDACPAPATPAKIRWDCGSIAPACPQTHFGPTERCDGIKLWRCRKTEPPCPGHKPGDPGCEEFESDREAHDAAIDTVCEWIHDIQGRNSSWVSDVLEKRGGDLPAGMTLEGLEEILAPHGGNWKNPAVAALQMLQKRYPTVFIYGNHDNYLIDDRITQRAGISRRQRLWENQHGVYIEHAHRLEKFLTDYPGAATLGGLETPTNHDGSITGYEATLTDYYVKANDPRIGLGEKAKMKLEPLADPYAGLAQQPGYWKEFAQIWLGRWAQGAKPPHIFVIGHTHVPTVNYVELDFRSAFEKIVKAKKAAAGGG